MGKRIIILDDPSSDLSPLSATFEACAGELSKVIVVNSRKELETAMSSLDKIHLVVLEDILGDNPRGGLEMVKHLRKVRPNLFVMVVVGEDNVDHGPELLAAGAVDYLVRGKNLDQLIEQQMGKIDHILGLIEENQRLVQELAYVRDLERARHKMIGDSPQIREVIEKIKRVARIPRPVLIRGERGTGKELVARAIHEQAFGNQDAPLVVVNCAAFTDNLLESEFFGYEPGAFTGATKRHKGKFEQAHNGTLFLDEIGNMSVGFQQKIMRVVEYGSLRRVGGKEEIRVNIRIIAATNADLKKKMDDGEFLRDLYDRLTFEVIEVPPLRQREGDIEILSRYFLHKFMEEIPTFKGKRFADTATKLLRSYPFPGNVRELKNIVERAVYRDTTNQITPADIGLQTRVEDIVEGTTFKEKTEAFEVGLINNALEDCDGNQAAAARKLGLSYHQLRHHLKKYGDRINQ